MIAEMLSKPIIAKGDYYDYEDDINKEEFDSAFLFYKEALERNEYYGIVPNYIFYNNDLRVNAMAAKYKDSFIISMNKGTIAFLLSSFRKDDLLEGSGLEYWIEFEKELDNSISNLMYQNALHFTFYHEMAHLVQKSELLELGLYEQPMQNDFSARRHILELDADEYSALSVGSHTLQYARTIYGDEVPNDKLEKLLVLVCASILIYLMSFPSNRRGIYYKESTHPHPIIRVTCIVFVIIGYSKQALEQIELDLVLDSKSIVNQSIELAEALSVKTLGYDYLSGYKDSVGLEADNIVAYIKEMREISNKDSTLAVDKWNLIARSLHE